MIFKGEAVCNYPHPQTHTHRSDSGSQKCPCQRATVRNHARAPSVKADLGTKWQVSGTLHPHSPQPRSRSKVAGSAAARTLRTRGAPEQKPAAG